MTGWWTMLLCQAGVLLLLWSFTSATPSGDHTCNGVVKHPVTVWVNVTEPVQSREYTWCLSIPPRCTKYVTKMKEVRKVMTEMHNKTITVCCTGFVEMNYKCVPACPPQSECPYMKCNRTNHCYCDPGYYGPFCSLPCPKGSWGQECKKECDCPDGFTCHHLTGDCILDDRPRAKPNIPTTTTTTTTTGPPSTTTKRTTIATVRIPITPPPTTKAPETLPPTKTTTTTTAPETQPPTQATLPKLDEETRTPDHNIVKKLHKPTQSHDFDLNPQHSEKPKDSKQRPRPKIEDLEPTKPSKNPSRKSKADKKKKAHKTEEEPTYVMFDAVTEMAENSVEMLHTASSSNQVKIISDDESLDSGESARYQADTFKVDQPLSDRVEARIERSNQMMSDFLSGFTSTMGVIALLALLLIMGYHIKKYRDQKGRVDMKEIIMAYGPPPGASNGEQGMWTPGHSTLGRDQKYTPIFFCPTFKNECADQLKKELTEFTYDFPRKTSSVSEHLYDEVQGQY